MYTHIYKRKHIPVVEPNILPSKIRTVTQYRSRTEMETDNIKICNCNARDRYLLFRKNRSLAFKPLANAEIFKKKI